MRIIFNGNGYDASWVEEAARRGLLNLSSTVDALPYYIHQKNLDVFERQKVFSAQEVHSRYEIKLENYVKVIDIEALSMLDIARRMILPAAIAYSGAVAQEAVQKKQLCPALPLETETRLLTDIQRQMDRLTKGCDSLQSALNEIAPVQDTLEKAQATRDRIVPAMGGASRRRRPAGNHGRRRLLAYAHLSANAAGLKKRRKEKRRKERRKEETAATDAFFVHGGGFRVSKRKVPIQQALVFLSLARLCLKRGRFAAALLCRFILCLSFVIFRALGK